MLQWRTIRCVFLLLSWGTQDASLVCLIAHERCAQFDFFPNQNFTLKKKVHSPSDQFPNSRKMSQYRELVKQTCNQLFTLN